MSEKNNELRTLFEEDASSEEARESKEQVPDSTKDAEEVLCVDQELEEIRRVHAGEQQEVSELTSSQQQQNVSRRDCLSIPRCHRCRRCDYVTPPSERSDINALVEPCSISLEPRGRSGDVDYIRPYVASSWPDHILYRREVEDRAEFLLKMYDAASDRHRITYPLFLARLGEEQRIPAVAAARFDLPSPTTFRTFSQWFELVYPGYCRYSDLYTSNPIVEYVPPTSDVFGMIDNDLFNNDEPRAANPYAVQTDQGQSYTVPAARMQPTVSSTIEVGDGAGQVPAARGCTSPILIADASVPQDGRVPNNTTVKDDGIALQNHETTHSRPPMLDGTGNQRGGGRPSYFISRADADMTVQHDLERQEHRVVDCLLRVGDQVWLRVTTRYRADSRLVQWSGRLVIEDVLAGCVFAVRNPNGERRLVHADRLQRYRENEPR